MPDALIYPTGGGTGLIGIWKAFQELQQMGLISGHRPRMYSVQPEGCAPIVRAFAAGEQFAEPWKNATTAAAGLRVPSALGDFLILKCLRDSGAEPWQFQRPNSPRPSERSLLWAADTSVSRLPPRWPLCPNSSPTDALILLT